MLFTFGSEDGTSNLSIPGRIQPHQRGFGLLGAIIVVVVVVLVLALLFLLMKSFRFTPPVTLVLETLADPSDLPLLHDLQGVNAGPRHVDLGRDDVDEATVQDATSEYQTLGVGYVRTHDNQHHLDVDDLYLGAPEYAMPPEDDTSYRWDASDVQFQAIVDAGMGVYLRIGGSSQDATTFLPRNPGTEGWETRWDNFQRVCKFIARHYVEHTGAFDPDEGYEGPMMAIEIWNEPNNEKFWDLGDEYFAEFYINLLEALKSEFPGLPVGGPGVGWGAFREDADGDGKPDWVTGFMGRVVDCSGDAMAKYRSPSFFSWHIYSPDPDDYVQAAQAYADLITGFWRTLDANCGTTLQGMESHVSEWNTKADNDENRGTGVGAAQLTGGWIGLAGEGVNRATFHRGMDEIDTEVDMVGYGLLTYSDDESSSRQIKPIGEAFGLWSDFVAAGGDRLRLTPSSSPAGFYSLARAASTGGVVILLTNVGEDEVKYQVQLPETKTTLPASSLSIDEIDASGARRNYTPSSVPVVLPANTVHLVRAGL